jgi:hypothetical protein
MQKPPSAPTPQGRAGRLLVQQEEEAKERVKQQGRTTRSDGGHSRPGYWSLRNNPKILQNGMTVPIFIIFWKIFKFLLWMIQSTYITKLGKNFF